MQTPTLPLDQKPRLRALDDVALAAVAGGLAAPLAAPVVTAGAPAALLDPFAPRRYTRPWVPGPGA